MVILDLIVPIRARRPYRERRWRLRQRADRIRVEWAEVESLGLALFGAQVISHGSPGYSGWRWRTRCRSCLCPDARFPHHYQQLLDSPRCSCATPNWTCRGLHAPTLLLHRVQEGAGRTRCDCRSPRRTPSPARGARHPLRDLYGPVVACRPMAFAADDLHLLDQSREVSIETRGKGGRTYRTVIWIILDEDEVFVRSVRGKAGRWYQRARADPSVRIVAGAVTLEATAVPATDAGAIERTSAGLRRKYPPGASLDSMLVPEVRPTTLRLDPIA